MSNLGIFESAIDAVKAAAIAQRDLMENYKTSDRQRMIDQIRKEIEPRVPEFGQDEFDETGYGRLDDKPGKNWGAVMATPGTELVPADAMVSSDGLTVEYYAPFGVVAAITPVTNPTATVVANTILLLAGGNTVVFNVHPASVKVATKVLKAVNQAIENAGGPANCACMPAAPSMETLAQIIEAPEVGLIVGTGGPAMVKALMASGKKVIAAGPGNPPSVIDETADLKKAAAGIMASCSFDNNLLCIAEKEIFVVDAIFDAFMDEMEALGMKRLTKEEGAAITKECLVSTPDGGYVANKKWVGKYAKDIAVSAGISVEGDPRICFFEAENDAPLVQTEQMMPVIPVVRCKDADVAMQWAYAAEHNHKHSASIWSNDIRRITKFSKMINTTVFVANGGTMAAFGNGGTGTNSPTIATPTGEGVTTPRSFLRKRRIAYADGLGSAL